MGINTCNHICLETNYLRWYSPSKSPKVHGPIKFVLYIYKSEILERKDYCSLIIIILSRDLTWIIVSFSVIPPFGELLCRVLRKDIPMQRRHENSRFRQNPCEISINLIKFGGIWLKLNMDAVVFNNQ